MARRGNIQNRVGAGSDPERISLAVNDALAQIQLARSRGGWAASMFSGLDNKRQCAAWVEYGFPEDISFQMLFQLYKRGGVAHGAVEKIVGGCWRTFPWVIQGSESENSKDLTPWERQVSPTLGNPRLWRTFKVADRRRLVGRYSGLVLHFRDNRKWNEPVRTATTLDYMTPVWASALQVGEKDAQGNPKYWTYTAEDKSTQNIHPDRLFILGDWRSDAIGFLEPAYNAFVSMEKVEGGSGESFLKNAARQIGVNFEKDIDLANIARSYGVTLEQFHERFNEAARDLNMGTDTLLITQGASASPLVTAVSDPGPTYNVNLQTAAAALDIPTKVLVGMQTGERASSEDQKYMNNRCQSRRTGDLGFDIDAFVEHLIRVRALPKSDSEITVMWDDLNEATTGERLANAKLMSEINQISLGTGEPAFTIDEIREAAGYENDAMSMLGEDDQEDDEE